MQKIDFLGPWTSRERPGFLGYDQARRQASHAHSACDTAGRERVTLMAVRHYTTRATEDLGERQAPGSSTVVDIED